MFLPPSTLTHFSPITVHIITDNGIQGTVITITTGVAFNLYYYNKIIMTVAPVQLWPLVSILSEKEGIMALHRLPIRGRCNKFTNRLLRSLFSRLIFKSLLDYFQHTYV